MLKIKNEDQLESLPSAEKIQKALEKWGYCIVSQVASPRICGALRGSMWDYLEGLGTGINRNDHETWTEDRWPFGPHGIVAMPDAGHTPFMWRGRTLRRVIESFRRAWGIEEEEEFPGMHTSFDRFNIKTEPESDLRAWPHVDQGPMKRNPGDPNSQRCCIQGFLSLTSNGPEEGGNFAFLEGSHKLFEQFYEQFDLQNHPVDYYQIKDSYEYNFLVRDNHCVPKYLEVKEGDLVLWDSRLFHWNTTLNKPGLRQICYVCMTPSGWTSDSVKAEREHFFKHKIPTSHWPYSPARADGMSGHLNTKEAVEKFKAMRLYNYPKVELSEEAYKLVN